MVFQINILVEKNDLAFYLNHLHRKELRLLVDICFAFPNTKLFNLCLVNTLLKQAIVIKAPESITKLRYYNVKSKVYSAL